MAFSLLWLVLIVQTLWMLIQHLHHHASWGSMWYPLIFTISFLLFALTHGRVLWITTLQRLLIGAAFLQAVSDRLGLLGPPGAPGIVWGDFAHFIHYTARVNSFMPATIIPSLAVLATIAEVFFGLALVLGIRISAAAIGSSILLFLFATAMTASGLSQFAYGVYMMAAGALVLTTVDASWLSVDFYLKRGNRKTA
ncbi:MAG: hypothetical protein ABI158_07705 [Edaphobacter sp.]